MPQAEGRTYSFLSPDQIQTEILETFPYSGVPQTIHIETGEFSAVCPFSGLPDIAQVVIEYIPGDMCVELKSLKYYLLSYRQVGIYQEAVTDKLFCDLSNLLQPQWLKVVTVYNTRGGIDTTCSFEKAFAKEQGREAV
ncbi:MAG: preQ(1) synthase [Bacillota bacterium]